MTAAVYLMACRDLVKIGLSEDVEGRLRTLRQNIPWDVWLVSWMRCECRKEAYRREQLLHYKCRLYHYKGEWFEDLCLDVLHDLPFEAKWELPFEGPRTRSLLKEKHEQTNPRNTRLVQSPQGRGL